MQEAGEKTDNASWHLEGKEPRSDESRTRRWQNAFLT